ncbi:protein FAR1-RELATED SEQUENCE 5 [Canna indica]|uniref:Protein FAR1-RELATED SEQUENCE 5 n=1 Tax=Canna indica TaxID=4628 RepID=A0AAQ3JYG4_9LILI|nr:protein FAR1-RELATED SEQUENCE 5 [Canna indica]
MDFYSKRRLELNDYAGIPLNKNFHSLVVEAKGFQNLPFGEKDCRNYIRYNMPFAPFVGVNHHGQSILFGCGLLSREDIETYVWLFRSWLECMHGRTPKAIITYQCRSIQAAMTKVFPESRHRLCLWHIMKKVLEKLSGLAKYKAIKKTLKDIVYESVKPQEFDEGWCRMIEDYGLEKNEWLSSLFLDRARWVPLYVRVVF